MTRVLLAVLLLLPAAWAGCLGDDGAGGAKDPRAVVPPRLPDGIALEGSEIVSRNDTHLVLAWRGEFPPGSFAAPILNERLDDAPIQSAALRLPPGGPLRVHATLRWSGNADLDLFLADTKGPRCRGDGGAGGTLESVDGEESCLARWIDARQEERAWRVDVQAWDNAREAAPFEVTVTVQAMAEPPRYNLREGPRRAALPEDPSQPGPFETRTAEYDFGAFLAQDGANHRPYPVRVLGVVHYPATGDGPFPVVLFQHGRHAACTSDTPLGDVFDDAPTSHCRGVPGTRALPSHRGHDDVGLLLASHGYVVASMDANDVNAIDSPAYAGQRLPNGDDGLDARGHLILRTLDGLREVHNGAATPTHAALAPLAGRLDLERIGLMGHSRGAEGATRAPGLAEETSHWSAGAYGAVYAIAGSRRYHLPDWDAPVVPGPTAYASVLPYCDGDAWNLGNAELHDLHVAQEDHGPLVQIAFMGANHNYYNAAWLDEDDAGPAWRDDPYCRPDETEDGLGYGRLSPEDQARHHHVYLPAFFRLFLGAETTFLPLFTGEAAPPSSACPAGADACPRLVHVSYHAPPAHRLVIEDAATADALENNDLGGASTFEGFDAAAWCDPFDAGPESPCWNPRSAGLAPRLALSWTGHAVWRTEIPAATGDITSYDVISFRLAVGNTTTPIPGAQPPRIRVTLEDASGTRATVDAAEHSGAIVFPPGAQARRLLLNQVAIPLDAFAGIDLSEVRAVEIHFEGDMPSAVQIAELMGMRTREIGMAGDG